MMPFARITRAIIAVAAIMFALAGSLLLALTLVPIERYPNFLKMESVDDVTQDSGAVLWVPKL